MANKLLTAAEVRAADRRLVEEVNEDVEAIEIVAGYLGDSFDLGHATKFAMAQTLVSLLREAKRKRPRAS